MTGPDRCDEADPPQHRSGRPPASRLSGPAKRGNVARHPLCIALLAAVGALAGCAAPSHAPPPVRSPLAALGAPRSVAVVVWAPGTPSAAMDPQARDVVRAGAGMGAAAGTAPLALAWGPAVIGGTALAAAAFGAVGGAWLYATSTIADTMAAELDRAVQAETARRALPALVAGSLQRTLVEIGDTRAEVFVPEVLDWRDGAAMASVRAQGHAALIDVSALDLRFSTWGGPDAEYALTLSALARLVDAASGRTLATRGLLVQSSRFTAAAWTGDGGRLATREVERVYRTLAERIVDAFVLQVPVQARQPAFGASGTCGVVHLQPRGRDTPLMAGPEPVAVDSRTPRLAWSAGPPADKGNAVPEGATDFRYDLRIWQVADGRTGELVIERFGLAAPTYDVESPLAANTTYGWSVRARYRVDGQPRATRWSAVALPGVYLSGRGRLPFMDALEASEAAVCSEEYLQACGCMDFLPAAALWKFRTPGP